MSQTLLIILTIYSNLSSTRALKLCTGHIKHVSRKQFFVGELLTAHEQAMETTTKRRRLDVACCTADRYANLQNALCNISLPVVGMFNAGP
jgi:hypothetical protein